MQEKTIRLCINCFNCKKKQNKIYCKLKRWEPVVDTGKTILFTPYDYNCPDYEEA